MLCWQRGQDSRRNELRAAVRALPAAGDCWRSRGSGWMAPRRAAARVKGQYPCAFPAFCAVERAADPAGAAAQVAHAAQRLTMSGERMTLGARRSCGRRRDRFSGLEIRLKASNLANAQAQRDRIARDRERVLRLSERARRALATALQRQQARIAHTGQLLTRCPTRAC